MTRWFSDIAAVLIVALVVGWVGVQYGRQSRASAGEAPRTFAPGASVSTQLLQVGTLSTVASGFGQVTVVPGSARSYSVPIEVLVEAVLVAPGENVRAGQPLVRVAPSPGANLALRQARADVVLTKSAYELAQNRLEMQLGSKSDVSQAKGAWIQAQAVLESLDASGVTSSMELASSEAGIVTALTWSAGAIVAPGASLLEVTPLDHLQASIWIEPEDARQFSVGAPVRLTPIDGREAVTTTGEVTMISSRVDPSTLLVQVGATLGGGRLLLGQYLRGELELDQQEGLLVPRSALVVRGDALVVYAIEAGVAHEHVVQLLGERGDMALIEGDGVIAGGVVVTSGVAGLSEGTTVNVNL